MRVLDDAPAAADALALLSKEQVQDRRIGQAWRAEFADRQVQRALRRLLSMVDPDRALLQLIDKNVAGLTADEIRASLGRVRVSIPDKSWLVAPQVFPSRPSAPDRPRQALPIEGRQSVPSPPSRQTGRATPKQTDLRLLTTISLRI